MGFIRVLHAYKVECQFPRKIIDRFGDLLCAGRTGFEAITHDPEPEAYLSVRIGFVAQFDDWRFNADAFIDFDKLLTSTYFPYAVQTIVDGIVYGVRGAMDFEPALKGLTILHGRDEYVRGIFAAALDDRVDEYVESIAPRMTAVHIEYDFVDYSEAEEYCLKERGCGEEEDEYERRMCVADCMDELPERFTTPIPQEIHALVDGKYHKGCKAFELVKHLLPEFDHAHWRRRCSMVFT